MNPKSEWSYGRNDHPDSESAAVSRWALRRLKENEVHVWRAALDLPASYLRGLGQVLTSDERAVASRFLLHEDRDQFVAARGLLRVILACYLGQDPGHLRFRYGPYGKPALAEESGGLLRFNIAHSRGLALYAVAWGRDLGVDLERIDPDLASREIAEQFFSPREADALRALPSHLWLDAFFACWTRKEAYIKARGGGLSISLKEFAVSLPPEEPAIVWGSDGESRATERWSLEVVNLGPGWAAALAAEGHGWQARFLRWPDSLKHLWSGLSGADGVANL